MQSAKILVKVSSGISKLFGHLNFNHTCLRESLLPKSLKYSPPIRTSRGYYKLARKHDFDFIKLRITESRIAINKKKLEVDQITTKLRAVLLKEQWDVLSQYNNQIQNGVKSNAKSNHQAKLGKFQKPMLAKTNNSSSQKSVWVKNLSKTKQLSSSQQTVLEKRINFAITSKPIPVLDIVASVEKSFKMCETNLRSSNTNFKQQASNKH